MDGKKMVFQRKLFSSRTMIGFKSGEGEKKGNLMRVFDLMG